MPSNLINKNLVEPVRKEIGRNFRIQRRRAGITPYLLGKKTKVTRKVIYEIERGDKNYTIDSLIICWGMITQKDKTLSNINVIYKSVKKWGTYRKIRLIHKLVCKLLDVNPDLVKSKYKNEVYLQPRYYCFKLMYELTKASHQDIANFYDKDRVSVLQGIREMDNLISTKNKMAQDYPIVFSKVSEVMGYDPKKD